MCLVVQSQGCVCVLEIVEGLILFPILLCNPVQELRAILLVLGVVPLILLKGQVVPLLFSQCGLAAVARQILREIVASDESGRVEDGSANHDSDSCHCVYVWFHISYRVCCVHSHIGWEYLLVLQILLQGDAARHDGCELNVVHDIGTGVFGQVFFDDLAPNPANPSDKAGDGCSVEERLHELVVRHGGVYLGFKLLFFTGVIVVFWFDPFDRHQGHGPNYLCSQAVQPPKCLQGRFVDRNHRRSPPAARPISAPFMTWSFMVYRVFQNYSISLMPRFTGMRDGAGVGAGAGCAGGAGLNLAMIASRW